MIEAIQAFGFSEPINPIRIVSERNLHMDRITERLRRDIPSFLKRYFDFPDDEFPDPRGEVPHVNHLLQEMFIGGEVLAMWATDHAKSITADKFFPILSLAENPDESHILVGANFADTKRRIQVIQRELETNQLLIADFPWLRKPKSVKDGGSGGLAWSRLELTVDGRSANRPDPSVYACAIGSSDIRGRRGKLIMDDIEGVRNSRYALTRSELYEFVKLEATRCYEDRSESKRPLLIALGTPFDPDSLYLRLEAEGWRAIRVPAYTVPHSEIEQFAYLKLPDGSQSNTQTPWEVRASLVPQRFYTWPRKRFKVAAADPLFGHGRSRSQFAIQYNLDPTEGKPGRLSIKQMQDLISDPTDPQSAPDFKSFVALDPASGVNSRLADYAGVAVVRLRWPRAEKWPQVQVLEAHRFEQGLHEQVNFCADLASRYQCDLMYEANSQQRGTYENAFRHLRPEVRLVPVWTTQGNKFDTEMGLTVIRTLIQQERLKVPLSQRDSEGIQTLLTEVRDLGTERHDHICAAVWFVVKWLYEQVRFANLPEIAPTQMSRRFGANPAYRRASAAGQADWRAWRR